MNCKQYNEFCSAVQEFFELEGINNLSLAVSEEDSHCPSCEQEQPFEAWFSWSPCECCSRPLGGDRVHATGFNPVTREIQCYDICPDCLYFATYGQLDDQTMLDIEDTE